MKKKRTYNTGRIKRDFSYSVQEASDLFKTHKNTVRQWIREGLPIIDTGKPYLIHGTDLFAFLKNRQKARKQTCQPHQLYCVKCRRPQSAWGNLADLTIKNEKLANLSALCGVCETPMNRIISRQKTANIGKIFIIQTLQEEHILDSLTPSVDLH